MQINKIGYNTNFGAKFSPEFKEYLREAAKYTYQGDYLSERTKNNFDKNIETLKRLFPDGELKIKRVHVRKSLPIIGLEPTDYTYRNTPYISGVIQAEKQVVLCRKGKKDILVHSANDPLNTDVIKIKQELLELKRLEARAEKFNKSPEGIEIQKRIDKVIG